MRIGMMADIYKPHISGVTNYISQYITHFESHGHEIYVFTFGDDGDETGEERVIRSPGLPLKDPSGRSTLLRGSSCVMFTDRLPAAFREIE